MCICRFMLEKEEEEEVYDCIKDESQGRDEGCTSPGESPRYVTILHCRSQAVPAADVIRDGPDGRPPPPSHPADADVVNEVTVTPHVPPRASRLRQEDDADDYMTPIADVIDSANDYMTPIADVIDETADYMTPVDAVIDDANDYMTPIADVIDDAGDYLTPVADVTGDADDYLTPVADVTDDAGDYLTYVADDVTGDADDYLTPVADVIDDAGDSLTPVADVIDDADDDYLTPVADDVVTGQTTRNVAWSAHDGNDQAETDDEKQVVFSTRL